jgi:hypothetical protein
VEHPALAALRPAAVIAACDAGDAAAAVTLAARWYTPAEPDGWDWMLSTALWGEVAARPGVPDPESLYALLAPYAGQVAVGNIIDCGGSVDRLLAELAERMGKRELALQHARAGLRLERRGGFAAWEPRSVELVERLREQPHDVRLTVMTALGRTASLRPAPAPAGSRPPARRRTGRRA